MSRIDRIASLIKHEVADILLRRVNDSRIGFITIVDVIVSKDLSHAKIYYSQLGSDKEKSKTRVGLAAAQKFIRSEVGKALKTRIVPDLHFFFDESVERGVYLAGKINDLTR